MNSGQLSIDFYAAQYPQRAGFKAEGASEDAARQVNAGRARVHEQITALLFNRGGMTASEVAAAIGLAEDYVSPRLSELFRLSRVAKAGRRLTDARAAQGKRVAETVYEAI